LPDWKNSAKGVLAGALTGTALGLGGFWLARIPETSAMGSVMFFLVPVCAGFAITIVTRKSNRMAAAALLAILTSLAILIDIHAENFLCAVLAFPILFVGLVIGIGIGIASGAIFRELTGKTRDVTYRSVVLLLAPLLILAGHRVEISTLVHPRREIVTSTIRVAADPTETWAALRSFDSLTANKAFLMYVGLPIPIRCVMQGSGVGAKRTCYFDQGYIEETVTEWAPPFAMGLSIDRTHMPWRNWLHFEDARYELHRDGGETVLTRTTTITSNLYPVWYWRPFERWGVASEHEYIFRDLARRLSPTALH